jgi:hypothetical protein
VTVTLILTLGDVIKVTVNLIILYEIVLVKQNAGDSGLYNQ